MAHGLQMVLCEPEIPQNTGSIGRLCVATQTPLHLTEPLGFEINESRVRRAGLDYWEHLNLKIHPSTEAWLESVPPQAPLVFFSKKAGHTLYEHRFEPGSWLVFGRETTGLPDWILNRYPTRTVRIPMLDARVRSLNLSQAAAISLYEAMRQLGF
ncbi:MAG TPA: tRNA (cytidine(34)-2'-O)-methyltransferase [Bdellovibrionota bacterium]|jgi:tRNA (cytidine/uridine-2'-O-)-methyltransferase|nr:tRNA (cytidine(34)-2'-O)-methyltransferase [Bdellovibrionota bacterium]